MAEYRKILELSVVVDSETAYDKIGDIDGGFYDDNWLEKHIRNYGSFNLLHRLASLTSKIISVENDVLRERDMACVATNKNITEQ